MFRFIGKVIYLLIVIGVILWLIGALKTNAMLGNEIADGALLENVSNAGYKIRLLVLDFYEKIKNFFFWK